MRFRVILFSLVLSVPMAVDAASAPRTFRELASLIVDMLSAGVATLMALAIVIYLYGIATNFTKLQRGEELGPWKNFVMWGIVIIFVMVSIWGILNILRNTFFEGEGAPPGVVLKGSHSAVLAYGY